MNCDTFSILLSIISLAVTIALGVGAIIQSCKYNKDSEKINTDTKYMLVQQIKMLNEIDKALSANCSKSGVLDFSKDKISFHKLSMFNKADIGNIKNAIRHLKIKGKFLDSIEEYLESNEIDYQCNFGARQRLMGRLVLKNYMKYC